MAKTSAHPAPKPAIAGDFRNAADFADRFEVVEVVGDEEYKILADLRKKYRKDSKIGKLFKALSDEPELEKKGNVGPKTQALLDKLKKRITPDEGEAVEQALRSIFKKLKEYQIAYDKTFKDEDEWLQYNSILYQFLLTNFEPKVERDVGFSKESAFFLRDRETGAIAGGGNHAVYGNNPGGKAKAPPSAFGIYAFVSPEYQMKRLGRYLYETSSRLMLKDLDRPELQAALIKNGFWRIAEINNPMRMSQKKLELDAVEGNVFFPWKRIKFLHTIGYRAIRIKALSPPYLDDETYTSYTKAVKYIFWMAMHRRVRKAGGKLALGGQMPPGLVPLDFLRIHLKHAFRQTFDRDGTEDDIATDLLRRMKKAVKKGFTHLSTHAPGILEAQLDDHMKESFLRLMKRAWPGKRWFKEHLFRPKEFPFGEQYRFSLRPN